MESFGRRRIYDRTCQKFGDWENLFLPETKEERISLNRGGILKVFIQFTSETKRVKVVDEMKECLRYRQYCAGPGNVYNEPRIHALYSSKPGIDYEYHCTKMKSFSLKELPEIQSLHDSLSNQYHLPGGYWNSGVDLIVYRDGSDSIGFHADDTQGEQIILTIIMHSNNEKRKIKIRPHKKIPLNSGDEEIELFLGEGDAYEMNGEMQKGYEHAVPKQKKCNSSRYVLVFRHGLMKCLKSDSGHPALKRDGMFVKEKEYSLEFGHPSKNIIEGKQLYSRQELYLYRGHMSDQRGICGNIKDGCCSIVVSRQDPNLREFDCLDMIAYTSTRYQGAGALISSYNKRLPVRVFRSSKLKSCWSPPMREGKKTSYRYDGLYLVDYMLDSFGEITRKMPNAKEEITFFLERYPHFYVPSLLYTNTLSYEDLREWIESVKNSTSMNQVKQQNSNEINNSLNSKMCIHTEIVKKIKRGNYPILAGIRDGDNQVNYFGKQRGINYYVKKFSKEKTPALVFKWLDLYDISEEDVKVASRLVVIKDKCFYGATCLKKRVNKNGKTIYSVRYDGTGKKSSSEIFLSEIHSVHNEEVITDKV